jgi:hypothetical protein
MKSQKVSIVGSVAAMAMILAGCAGATLSPERIANIQFDKANLTSVFPSGYRITMDESPINSAVVPCEIDVFLQDQGSEFKSVTTFDARLNLEDPTYYRVEALRFASAEPFEDLRTRLEDRVNECGYPLEPYTVGNARIMKSADAKPGVRDLSALGLPAESVFQFSYEFSNLVMNTKTLYSDGTHEIAEVFVINSDTTAMVLVVKGRNFENSAATFEYLNALVAKVLESLKE